MQKETPGSCSFGGCGSGSSAFPPAILFSLSNSPLSLSKNNKTNETLSGLQDPNPNTTQIPNLTETQTPLSAVEER